MAIGIYRNKDGWIATWRVSTRAAEMRELYGTTEIPTAYTRAMTEVEVRSRLEELNPGEDVFRIQDVR